MSSRGIRNKNFSNMEAGPFAAKYGCTGSDGRFAICPTMAKGAEIAARNLIGYNEAHGIDTIRGTINRWAPSNENDTQAYINFVAHVCEVRPDDKLDFHDTNTLFWLLTAIGENECGHDDFLQNVSDNDLDTGIAAALGQAPT